MKRSVWLAIVLLVGVPFVLLTVSCTKNVVQTESVTMTEPEAPTEPVVAPQEESEPLPVLGYSEPEVPEPSRPEIEFSDENIHFAFDSYNLSEPAQQVLSRLAEYLRTNPDITVTIEGHCDDRGTDDYNLALGERRAESARVFLGNLGVGNQRLNTISYGEERPVVTGQNESAWARNRRAQFVIN